MDFTRFHLLLTELPVIPQALMDMAIWLYLYFSALISSSLCRRSLLFTEEALCVLMHSPRAVGLDPHPILQIPLALYHAASLCRASVQAGRWDSANAFHTQPTAKRQ